MGFHAFQMGNNVIAYEKNGHKYGMTCAWATMIDQETIFMLIGGQSDTGNNLEVGDIVGVSSLSKGQKEISLHFGSNHSKEENKFKSIDISNFDGAILIPNAKVQMVAKVIKIEPSIADKNDHMVFLQVIKHLVDKEAQFLDLGEVLPE